MSVAIQLKAICLRSILVEAKCGFAVGERATDGVIQLRMNNVSISGDLDLSQPTRVPASIKQQVEYLLQEGDVLFNNTNSPSLVGKSTYFPGHSEPVLYSNHFTRLRFDKARVDSKYVAYWLTQKQRSGYFEGRCKQWVNQASFGRYDLMSLEIPLPDLEEQRRIAAILDRANIIYRKRQEAIQELINLPAALFSELFGDPISNSKGFPIAELRELVSLIGGFAFRSEDYQSEGIPLIRIGNANNSRFSEDALVYLPENYSHEFERYILYPGDMIMTLTGTVGKDDYANIVEVPDNYDRWFLNQRVAKVTLNDDRLNKEFLIQLLMTPHVKNLIRRMDRGVRQANLRNEDILSQRVPVPPKNLQEKFASGMRQFQRLRQNMILQQETSDGLFHSLVQRAFKGEL